MGKLKLFGEYIMGNRALISFKEENQDKKLAPSIYLHWQGGRDSVEAFLEASQILGIRGNDGTYCIGRMTQVIGNALGGTLSLGVGCYGNFGTEWLDHGVYWIKDWKIIDRELPSFYDEEEFIEQREYDHDEFVKEILQANESISFGGAK